jgi:F0F1-type ATP synthase assembly protein I
VLGPPEQSELEKIGFEKVVVQLLPTKRTVERVGAAGNEGVAKGIDFVFVLLFFAGLGWLVDRALGTRPWFTLGLFALGIVGQFARLWYAYDAEMTREEQRLAERRRP